MKLEKILEELHNDLAQHLLTQLKSGELRAADLNVIRQFLKDNGIDGVPKGGGAFEDLVGEMHLPEFLDDGSIVQ